MYIKYPSDTGYIKPVYNQLQHHANILYSLYLWAVSDDQAFNEVAHRLSDHHPRVSQYYTVPGIFCPGSWRETWGSLMLFLSEWSIQHETMVREYQWSNEPVSLPEALLHRLSSRKRKNLYGAVYSEPNTAALPPLPLFMWVMQRTLGRVTVIKHSCSFKQTPDSTASGHFYVTNEFSLIQFIQLILIRTHAVLLSSGNWQGCC